MKIYDCFTFYNELDLLELRLTELSNFVDRFVIVEATTTFTNRPKPLLYKENQERYVQWANKIEHIVIDTTRDPNPWANETAQRDAILRGVWDASDEDIIIVSDVDEIPRPAAVDYLRTSAAEFFGFRMSLSNFKFNYMRTTPGEYDIWAMASRRRHLGSQFTPNTLRGQRFNLNGFPYQHDADGVAVIEHGGWHFGYMGDTEYLRDKAQSFSHQEVNTPEFLAQIDIDASIRERKEWNRKESACYEIVKLDNYFPASVKKYPEFILDDTEISAYNLLPPYPYL
jgi:hypothetical protein